MFSEKDAPYLVVLIVGGLGWLVTFLSQQYLSFPTIEVSETRKVLPSETVGEFGFSNVSRGIPIRIGQIDFDGMDVGVTMSGTACGEFLNVSPHKISEVPPPIESGDGKSGSCQLPLTIRNVVLAPGASFGVKIKWKGPSIIKPYIVAASAAEISSTESSGTRVARVVNFWSADALVARYLTEMLLVLGGLGSLVLAWAIVKRAKKGENTDGHSTEMPC